MPMAPATPWSHGPAAGWDPEPQPKLCRPHPPRPKWPRRPGSGDGASVASAVVAAAASSDVIEMKCWMHCQAGGLRSAIGAANRSFDADGPISALTIGLERRFAFGENGGNFLSILF
jgi:hypothetical protein